MASSGELRLEDRLGIQDALNRYVRGVDRRDWELVRSAYHADGWDDHGDYKGGIDGFIEVLKKRHAVIEQSMHVIANCVIEFDSADGAVVETYFIVYQRISPAAGDARTFHLRGRPCGPDDAVDREVVGRYVDRMTRRDGVWRVARRTVVFEKMSGEIAVPGGGMPKSWVQCRRDGADPIEALRREVGLA